MQMLRKFIGKQPEARDTLASRRDWTCQEVNDQVNSEHFYWQCLPVPIRDNVDLLISSNGWRYSEDLMAPLTMADLQRCTLSSGEEMLVERYSGKAKTDTAIKILNGTLRNSATHELKGCTFLCFTRPLRGHSLPCLLVYYINPQRGSRTLQTMSTRAQVLSEIPADNVRHGPQLPAERSRELTAWALEKKTFYRLPLLDSELSLPVDTIARGEVHSWAIWGAEGKEQLVATYDGDSHLDTSVWDLRSGTLLFHLLVGDHGGTKTAWQYYTELGVAACVRFESCPSRFFSLANGELLFSTLHKQQVPVFHSDGRLYLLHAGLGELQAVSINPWLLKPVPPSSSGYTSVVFTSRDLVAWKGRGSSAYLEHLPSGAGLWVEDVLKVIKADHYSGVFYLAEYKGPKMCVSALFKHSSEDTEYTRRTLLEVETGTSGTRVEFISSGPGKHSLPYVPMVSIDSRTYYLPRASVSQGIIKAVRKQQS